MKDSGIPWIGEIPKDWSVMPHKRVMYKVKEIQEHYNGENILSLTMRGVIVRDLEAGGKMPTSFDGYQKVYPNNLLQCLFDIDVTPRCVGLIRNEGLSSPAYSQFAMYPNGYAPYYDYLLRYMDDRKTLLHLSKNLRSSLTETDFGAIYTCVPSSIEEQQRIAEFLDRKCAEIDEMIGLQEQMIEELKAYKQSVITEAVTKGIRNEELGMRNGELGVRNYKDSGIEWIGDVPEEWEVTKFYRVCSVITDFVASGSFESLRINVPYHDYPDYAMLVRTIDLSGKGRVSEKVYISKHSYDFLNNSNLFGGEIILPNIGASVGDVYIVPNLYERMSLAPNSIMFKTKQCDKYWYYYFYSEAGKRAIFNICQSTAQPKFNKTELRDIRVCIPTNKEQQAIADYLDKKCGEIDELITIKQQKIESLKEYKKSVIYEYVTGKREA